MGKGDVPRRMNELQVGGIEEKRRAGGTTGAKDTSTFTTVL